MVEQKDGQKIMEWITKNYGMKYKKFRWKK